MTATDGTSLETLAGIPKGLRDTLGAAGITTVEQLLGSTAAVGGATKMAGHLGVAATDFRRIVEQAEAALSPQERDRLRKPVDTRKLGLGARHPSDKG